MNNYPEQNTLCAGACEETDDKSVAVTSLWYRAQTRGNIAIITKKVDQNEILMVLQSIYHTVEDVLISRYVPLNLC